MHPGSAGADLGSLTHSDSCKGGEFTVVLFDVGGGSVRAEVLDDGGPTIPARQDCGELAVTGRGVALIEDLAVRSGWFTDDKGLLHTWFEVEPAT